MIISIVSAMPIVGASVVHLVWAGYSVDLATVSRFFAIHYLLPLVWVILVLVHLTCLHDVGSTSPTCCLDYIPFDPYFRSKDGVGLMVGLGVCVHLTLQAPNLLGHPDN